MIGNLAVVIIAGLIGLICYGVGVWQTEQKLVYANKTIIRYRKLARAYSEKVGLAGDDLLADSEKIYNKALEVLG